MLWQGVSSTRDADRQGIITALNHATADMRELILAVEMTADSADRIVRTIHPTGAVDLRNVLEKTLSAFEQRPELSHLGVILPDTGEYGNLERSTDGTIFLWLYPGSNQKAVTRSLRLTSTGFVPHATYPGQTYDLRIRPVYQMAIQGSENGTWMPTHPWIVHGDRYGPLWGFSYVKPLYDSAGHLIAVLDANFDMSALQAYVQTLQTLYDLRLDVIELGEIPKHIGGDPVTHTPQSLPEAFAPLLTNTQTPFADTLHIGGERRWVATRPFALEGGVSWLLVASRAAPLLDAPMGRLLYHTLGMLLLIAVVLMLITRHMARRFGQPLEHLATHDYVTDLPNRLLIQRHIAQAITHARATSVTFALLYLDLDRFKTVNDNYGHRFGNRVLKAVGERIKHLVRPQDTVAYLSGNRFLILLTALREPHEAEHLARHILQGLDQTITVQDRDIHLTASIGVSLFPQHGDTPDALISSADLAMYRAKQLGSNTYQWFTHALQQETQARIDLETRLRDAVQKNQLHLVYQPKVSLQTGCITGCEALLRWTHPELGAISPKDFIPIAEDSGLIIPIGDWVLHTACAQAKAWLDAGLAPVHISVNLSARQFLQQDVVTWMRNTLTRTGLPPECLELELTESLFPQDIEKAIHIIDQIQAIGVHLAIDDFGTGYSNLNHLKRFRLQTLKIDQGFVRNATTAAQDAAIVRTVIKLAHTMNFKALAEGVETVEQMQFLRDQQCDEIQGYYFSHPLCAEAFENMLRAGTKLDNMA